MNGIEIENYILKPEKHQSGTFNLVRKGVNKQGKETHKTIAHAITLPKAISIIAETNVWTDNLKIGLDEYLIKKEAIVTSMLIEIEKLSKVMLDYYVDTARVYESDNLEF